MVPKHWPAVMGLGEIHQQDWGVQCCQAAGAFVPSGDGHSQQELVVGHKVLLGMRQVAGSVQCKTAGRKADWSGAGQSLLVGATLLLFALGLVWAGCSTAVPCDPAGNANSQQNLLVTALGLGCRSSLQRRTRL